MVKRWDVETLDERTSSEGRWVLHSDHEAAIAEKDREIAVGEEHLAEAMRIIARHDADMEATEALAIEHKQRAERAEAQRDALVDAIKSILWSRIPGGHMCAQIKKVEEIAMRAIGMEKPE